MKQLLRGEYKEVHYEEIYGNGSWSYGGSCSGRMCADGRNTGETSEHGTAPAGAAQQETVDGVAEKESMVVTDADPTVTVCVYSVKI
mgnify:FL=1